MDLVNIVLWIIIRGMAGWLAGRVIRGYGFGILANIVTGIVGAVIGRFVFDALGLRGSN